MKVSAKTDYKYDLVKIENDLNKSLPQGAKFSRNPDSLCAKINAVWRKVVYYICFAWMYITNGLCSEHCKAKRAAWLQKFLPHNTLVNQAFLSGTRLLSSNSEQGSVFFQNLLTFKHSLDGVRWAKECGLDKAINQLYNSDRFISPLTRSEIVRTLDSIPAAQMQAITLDPKEAHQIIGCIDKNTDLTFNLNVLNTGLGINKHPSKKTVIENAGVTIRHRRYNHVYQIRGITKSKLIEFLSAFSNKPFPSIQKLYDKHLPKLGKVAARSQDEVYDPDQMGPSCAARVLFSLGKMITKRAYGDKYKPFYREMCTRVRLFYLTTLVNSAQKIGIDTKTAFVLRELAQHLLKPSNRSKYSRGLIGSLERVQAAADEVLNNQQALRTGSKIDKLLHSLDTSNIGAFESAYKQVSEEMAVRPSTKQKLEYLRPLFKKEILKKFGMQSRDLFLKIARLMVKPINSDIKYKALTEKETKAYKRIASKLLDSKLYKADRELTRQYGCLLAS